MIHLKYDNTDALIDPVGAELKSLKLGGREYLWQGDPSSWSGQSPQLFPVIGMTPEGGWQYEGNTLVMENHGFARKSLFSVVESSNTDCLLRLEESDASLAQYPFPFILDIAYSLTDGGLSVSYRVENKQEGDMLFSLGAHPGFNCPLVQGSRFEDYYLEFEKDETISRRWKEDFLTGKKDPVLTDSRRIELDHSLFDKGAIILSGLQSDSVVLKSDTASASVRMNFAGFPDFGIWTIAGKNAPYICLEPWFGVDSSEGDSRDFEEKEGLLRLQGHEEFSCSYSLALS
ncbi:MAG: aldose 1-epimerase family protein [Spirochaetales bacterium]|nr:aldose 1-epimerase family protein [Spirochaetales bacterium]